MSRRGLIRGARKELAWVNRQRRRLERCQRHLGQTRAMAVANKLIRWSAWERAVIRMVGPVARPYWKSHGIDPRWYSKAMKRRRTKKP